jgi:two-component system phosphate regulon sensor histidine kinase PhoR
MKKTVFLKLFGGYVLVAVGLCVLILGFSFSKIKRHYEETLARDLTHLSQALAPDIQAFLERGQVREMEAFLQSLGRNIQTRITVIDPQGVVLADSERDPAAMENHRYRPEVAQALEGQVGQSIRFSDTVEERMLYVGVPLIRDGRTAAVLRASLFMRNVDALIAGLRGSIGRAAALIALGAVLLALMISLHFLRPIRKLTEAARRVAGGDFKAKVVVRHKDEFRDLSAAFNLMTERIHELFEEARAQKEELAQVISSIQEALLVVNRGGRITFANDDFKKLVDETRLEGQFVWEVVRKPKILEFIQRTMAGDEPHSERVQIDGRILVCGGGRIGGPGGVVLTFHDVTEVRKVEAMKRDFVVNVSHELRTPLAAIMGAMETLEDEPASRPALDILKRHAERLRRLVEDILKLAELEDRGYRLDVQEVDLREIADRTVRVFAKRISEKKLDAGVEASPDLPKAKADPYQIEQMLINLVDNAVKYTEQGRVLLALRAEPSAFIIEVKDTGPGIPAEHLPRIFERFYVVDKSRSRQLGGTGLGLSIAKHIAELHGGTISASSEEGRGTTFTVRLPRYG